MKYNINPNELMAEIYKEVKNNHYNEFNGQTYNSVLTMVILTVYNEVVNKGNTQNLIFNPSGLENVNSTDVVELQNINPQVLHQPVGSDL